MTSCTILYLVFVFVILENSKVQTKTVSVKDNDVEYFNNLNFDNSKLLKTLKQHGSNWRNIIFPSRIEEDPRRLEYILENTTPKPPSGSVINVTPNCQQGFKPDVAGICRQMWRSPIVPFGSVINVPYNNGCVDGWKPDSKGICRPMWEAQNIIQSGPIIDVPKNNGCESGSKPDTKGVCRKMWRKRTVVQQITPSPSNDLVPLRVFFDEEANNEA